MTPERKREYVILYGAALVIIAAIGITWYIARARLRHYEGREVQALLTKSNMATDKSYQAAGHNYAGQLAKMRPMTPDQRKKADEIYTRGTKARNKIWMDGRIAAESEEETVRKQAAEWKKYNAEFEAMMAGTR